MARRIALFTFGSFGDLHPYLAVALELKRRGHRPVVATSSLYRDKVARLGLEFHAVRPELPDPKAHTAMMERFYHPSKGTRRIVCELFVPPVAESFADSAALLNTGVDAALTHPLTFGAVLAAERSGLPWLSVALAPIGMMSALDPSIPPGLTLVGALAGLGPGVFRGLFWAAKRVSRPWLRPVDVLRAELGMPRSPLNPLFDGQYSPHGTLGLFSRHFAAPQPDWPTGSVATGFPFYDGDARATAGPAIDAFLDAGPPPVTFTLGSSALYAAGDFYRHALDAARRVGRRALLLVGDDARNLPASLPEWALAADYAPHSAVFPRSAAVVHQGGIGTTAQALRAGVPALVVPFAHDQPDNARRVARLGVGKCLPRSRLGGPAMAAALRPLLERPRYAERARAIGARVRAEDGAGVAAEVLAGVGRLAALSRVGARAR